MSKKKIIPVQGGGSVSRVTAPLHQLGVECGGADHVSVKQSKDREKMLKKGQKDTVKAIKAGQ